MKGVAAAVEWLASEDPEVHRDGTRGAATSRPSGVKYAFSAVARREAAPSPELIRGLA